MGGWSAGLVKSVGSVRRGERPPTNMAAGVADGRMSLLGVGVSVVVTAILGAIALLSLAAATDFAARTYTGFLPTTPAADVDDGIVKVHGTVAADRTLDPAVADEETVLSMITRYTQEGLSGKAMNAWDEDAELLRAVPFEVVDDSGAVPVEHVEDPHPSGYAGLGREATGELEGGDPVPDAIDAAFTEESPDIDAVVEALEAEGDAEAAALAAELRAGGDAAAGDDAATAQEASLADGNDGASREDDRLEPDGGTDPAADVLDDAAGGPPASGDGSDGATSVLEDASPLRTGTPQKFEEVYAAPGDEVYVIGRATDGDLTNASGTFQVLHEPRSTFELLKGAAGAVALVGIGLAAGYGTVNWLLQLGRELLGVVAFIA